MSERTRVVDQVKSAQTRAGLERARARGRRLGRPGVPEDVRRRIILERARGRSLRAIADILNDDQVPTGHDGRLWRASSVHWILNNR